MFEGGRKKKIYTCGFMDYEAVGASAVRVCTLLVITMYTGEASLLLATPKHQTGSPTSPANWSRKPCPPGARLENYGTRNERQVETAAGMPSGKV